MHPAATMDHRGIRIPFDLLQKAALWTPVADYLFDFDSQGLITVRSFTTSSPWMSVGSCFSNCSVVFLTFFCNLLEIILINYGKPSSGGSIDRGSGPPGVHQIGGPNFGKIRTA